MDFGLTDKTIVKHFLTLTETVLTTKQARQAADLIKEKAKTLFLEKLEATENKLDFLDRFSKEFFWTDNFHSERNWYNDYNKINDGFVLDNWDFVKAELGIESTQIIIIEKKEYRTLLDYKAMLWDLLELKSGKENLTSYWKWDGVFRALTPYKKSLTKKNGSLNINSEFIKKIQLKTESDKTRVVIKRDNDTLNYFIKSLFKAKKDSVGYLQEKASRERNTELAVLHINLDKLTVIRLTEMRF